MKKILKRKKPIIILAVIIVLILILVLWAKAKLSSMSEISSAVELEEVQKRDLSDSISLTGTVSGENKMNYASSAGSEIKTLNVIVGDEVKEGDVLATLDTEAIQRQIDMIEKSIADASALEQNQNKLNQHALELAKEDQKTQLAAANQAISAAQSEYDAAVREQNALKGQIDSLTGQMNASQDAEWKAELAEKISALKEQLVSAQSAVTGASQAVADAKNQYQSVKSSTDEAIYSAQNAVDMQKYSASDNTDAMTQLDQLYDQLNDCTITSQTSGIVTAVNVSVGDTNTPGTALITVENNTTMIMTASVDEKDILKLQEGMKAVVTADALEDQEIGGEVIKVIKVYGGAASDVSATDDLGMSAGSSSGGFSVQIRLEDSALLSGMSAKAKITLSDKTDILSVPYDLVMEDEEGQSYILCGELNDDGTYTAVKKVIETGEEVNYYVEVRGGDLKEGDYLIMDYSVQEGDTFEASILSDEEGIDGISAEM